MEKEKDFNLKTAERVLEIMEAHYGKMNPQEKAKQIVDLKNELDFLDSIRPVVRNSEE